MPDETEHIMGSKANAERLARSLSEAKNATQKPSVGRIVHYVSYGTPGGEYKSKCRAAIITETNEIQEDQVNLAVLNPTGMFFNVSLRDEDTKVGGTWHWPERVE